MDKVNELSEFLVRNKFETANGNKRYDTVLNLATLEKLAHQYQIRWDEDIFNDDIENDL